MPVLDFLDSNVLVYAYDISDPKKQRVAQALVERAVAGEVVASRKCSPSSPQLCCTSSRLPRLPTT